MKPGLRASAEEAAQKMLASPDQFTLAYGFAFAPNLDRHPPYFDYPFQDLEGDVVRDDAAWKKWESGFGGIADEALLHKENFLKLKGIAVDLALPDQWIRRLCLFGEHLAFLSPWRAMMARTKATWARELAGMCCLSSPLC
jgi:hypothetical protein